MLKAGFLGSARFGSGVIVARLPDGTWSAPSAIGSLGAGFGGQIGFEVTDFVFVLNDSAAVRTFSQAGSLTLGGNVSIAAGPVGRNAEAAGAASLKGVAGVFAYSKTKGLFAGVSLEGSGFIERRDANEKMYGQRLTASQLLSGFVPVPPAAEPLMQILNSRAFTSGAVGSPNAAYNDVPVYDDAHEDVVWQGRRGSAFGEQQSPTAGGFSRASRSNTWQDDVYDRQPAPAVNRAFNSRANPDETFDTISPRERSDSNFGAGEKPKPARPTAPKPLFGAAKRSSMTANQAIAKFTFDGEQDGDLSFKKGEIITIVKKTENETDWWTGRVGGREGIFPRFALLP